MILKKEKNKEETWLMKQHGTHDINVTDNTRAMRWRWRVNYIHELYCYLILYDGEKSVC